MINNDLILNTDISTLNLIYGEMKNRMYQAQCALEIADGADPNYHYLEGLLDAYGFVYTEIDRVMHMRGER
jgi:hypothetical protein